MRTTAGEQSSSDDGTKRCRIFHVPTTDKVVPTARFRNVPMHTYGNAIDYDDVYAALHDLKRYRDFRHDACSYLTAIDAL